MKIISHSAEETLFLGKKIAKQLQKGDIICLNGELGSGKTVLAKGIAMGLGIKKEKIISPTFVLIRRQKTKKDFLLNHFDLYRLKTYNDILALGYEEFFFGSGVTLIEWAQRLKKLMPKECLRLKLFVTGANKRRIEFNASGIRHKKLLKDIDENFRY